jgi:hypothetical protein
MLEHVIRWWPRCLTTVWRGYADPEIGPWLQERLQLIHASSLTALTDITRARRWSISTRCFRISRKARW